MYSDGNQFRVLRFSVSDESISREKFRLHTTRIDILMLPADLNGRAIDRERQRKIYFYCAQYIISPSHSSRITFETACVPFGFRMYSSLAPPRFRTITILWRTVYVLKRCNNPLLNRKQVVYVRRPRKRITYYVPFVRYRFETTGGGDVFIVLSLAYTIYVRYTVNFYFGNNTPSRYEQHAFYTRTPLKANHDHIPANGRTSIKRKTISETFFWKTCF